MGRTRRFKRFRHLSKEWFQSRPQVQGDNHLETTQTIPHLQQSDHDSRPPLHETNNMGPVQAIPRVQQPENHSVPPIQQRHDVDTAQASLQHTYYYTNPQIPENKHFGATQTIPRQPYYCQPSSDGPSARSYNYGVAQPALDRGYRPHGGGYNPIVPSGLYHPLQPGYIRLLQLQPGQWNDLIRCSLLTVDLNAAGPIPAYEAVSYSWGNASFQKKLICNGHSMQVTRSLYDALQVFRQSHEYRTLWVDALCINQGDLIERKSQVQLMNRIYPGALSVAVWLGHDKPDSIRMALNILCHAAGKHWRTDEEFDPASGSLIPQSPQYYFREDASLYPKVEIPTHLDIKNGGLEDLEDLEVLFGCSWFCRLWVIQELVLSARATFYWGLSSIDCNLVGAAVSQLLEDRHDEVSRLKIYNELSKYYQMWKWWRGQWPADFFEALCLARSSTSTDPRDKIYGMLGIPTEDSRSDGTPFLEPDYESTTAEVFVSVAIKILVEQQNLDLLSMVQHKDRIPAKYQSWMPDWANSCGTASLCDPRRRTSSGEKAVIVVPSFPNIDNVVYRGATSIRGILLQDVKLVDEEIFDPDSDFVDGAFPSKLQGLFSRYKDKHEHDVLACTYTAGFAKHGLLDAEADHGTTIASHTLDYRCFMDCDTSSFIVDASSRLQIPSSTSPEALKRAFRFYSMACKYVIRRRLFIMNDGSLGLGPLAMRPGDIVVIFFGGGVPYVLRPTGDNLHYRFVGECYVHPVMDGSAVRKWRESGVPSMDFHIF